MTSETDRQRLLQIARDAIVAHVSGAGSGAAVAISASGSLERPGGAFVSIHHRGELRGCIGHLEANQSLVRVVRECAVAACSADPRFPPVSEVELVSLEIEVSLLGPFEPVVSPDDIEIGGGLYAPDPHLLLAVRQHIAEHHKAEDHCPDDHRILIRHHHAGRREF